MKDSIIVGSRGSALALRQAELVIARLRALYPRLQITVKKIKTKGDEVTDVPLPSFGGKGVFVKELESALLAGEIDIAVHSLKDLPTDPTPGLCLAAIPSREDARDALVSRNNLPLKKLPSHASVGTSSLRRAAQLKRVRGDIQVKDIRGNLDTRLRKVDEGHYDATVVAAAGLIRMGWQHRVSEYLSPEVCLTAVGQGALAIQARAADEETLYLVSALDHPPTRTAVTAERSFLQRLGGGCQMPYACYAEMKGELLHLDGMVATPDGERLFRLHTEGRASDSEHLGSLLAEGILSEGAGEILSLPGREQR